MLKQYHIKHYNFRLVIYVVALTMIGISVIGSAQESVQDKQIAGLLIGLVAMLGGIMQALIFFKCPKCGMLLKIRGKKPNCCHGCGYRLDL